MIRLNKIEKIYDVQNDNIPALSQIDLEINDGEFVAVMGTSGSGKSTLLHILGGMDSPTSGTYYYDDIEVSKLRGNALHIFRKEKISFVFQNFALMNAYTFYENIEMPLKIRNVSATQRKEIILPLLEKLGIEQLKDKRPLKTSGGQQQRCAIARAIASGAPVLLADEPTGALDQKTGKEIMDILKMLNEKEKKTIILVTHDEKVAAYADRVLYLQDGKMVKGTNEPSIKGGGH
ncbi:MAG: ABC transporter ATP-binding protein [Lachnospiraceae bacterium]|nr:ABC transporter ATP-binding protein [Lachnospiraceae bacterium]